VKDDYDAIVIGSGFGACFAAEPLLAKGARVLMLERGGWVMRGPHNWGPRASMELTPHYSVATPFEVVEGGQQPRMGLCTCVGGQSVFYGGVSFRLRERDFLPKPEIVGESGAEWPLRYADLEQHYEAVERWLDVAGEAGADPGEPPRSIPFPQRPAPLSETSRMVGDAGRALGLRPFPLPLAIKYRADGRRSACVACPTCDTFACAVEAKNDLATAVLPRLIERGLELKAETPVVRLVERQGRVAEVECVDRGASRRVSFRADRVILAAGALATPQLLLASALDRLNPAADAIGRYLTRHCNGITFGLFRHLPDEGKTFHKQLAFNDFYFGDSAGDGGPGGMLGSIQQLQTPPIELVLANAPRLAGPLLTRAVPRITGLLVMAEDQPRPENRLWLDPLRRDELGLPVMLVRHRHTRRDRLARRALARQAKRILRAAGALFCYTHEIRTFSHAAGTVRVGDDPRTAPLDRDCRFRGVENLFVVDASVMPGGGGVNPSLTIAANALRVGTAIARGRVGSGG
jgi:choline dehydrogenase-like flavoprotein